MTIGEKIKQLRLSQKYTQDELAEAAKTTKQTIHKYETGIIENIPASKVKALADKLGTTPAYLMGWEDVEIERQGNLLKVSISPHEQKVIKEYRAKPEMQPAVDKLLGIENEDNISPIVIKKQKYYLAADTGEKVTAEELTEDEIIDIKLSE